MSTPSLALSNATQKRRRQRRPDLQSEMSLAEDLRQAIRDTCAALEEGSKGQPSLAKPVGSIVGHLETLCESATTPDRQLQLIPRITEQLRDGKITGKAIEEDEASTIGATAASASAKREVLASLLRTLVFPFLLDCRVRYLHRGLTSLLRTAYPTGLPDDLISSLHDIFTARVIHAWETHEGRPCLFPFSLTAIAGEAGTVTATANVEKCGENVLLFLNCIDGLSGTLMPYVPSLLHDTFLQVLPLLSDALQWSVANAVVRRRRAAPGTTSGSGGVQQAREVEDGAGMDGAVFGEDLEHIRFCVRVVATYTHKYTDRLTAVWGEKDGSPSAAALLETTVLALSRSLEVSVFMLSSDSFPKDVLNAAGLLMSNTLTVRTCSVDLVFAVCDYIYQGRRRFDNAASRGREAKGSGDDDGGRDCSGNGHAVVGLSASIRAVMKVICAADPVVTLGSDPSFADAMREVFGFLSCNGVYAFFKGLLAHLSSPIRGDLRTVGTLLQQPLHSSTEESAVSALFDRIVPLAEQGSAVVELPEMRFMAIQTVDCVVRHIVSVFSLAVECVAEAESSSGGSPASRGGAAGTRGKKKARVEEGTAPRAGAGAGTVMATSDLVAYYATICHPSKKLTDFLNFATRLVMDLWDDGTQHMSGPLYETYDRVLRANELLARFLDGTQSSRHHTDSDPAAAASVRSSKVLSGVLRVPNERRGKYHALLSLLTAMPLGEFLGVVTAHYGEGTCQEGVGVSAGDVAHVGEFARMLLGGASNHKVASVAGDVFAKVAGLVYAAWRSDTESSAVYGEVLTKALLETLALAIVRPGYTTVSTNVSESVSIANVVSHFVYPLLKQTKELTAPLMDAVLGTREDTREQQQQQHGSSSEARRRQGVVEILARARSSGVDIGVYLQPDTACFRVVRESLQSMIWDVRRIALALCVHSTRKVEPVVAWQCAVVEQFLALNMNLGGDTVARRELTTAFRQWLERLMDSYKNAAAALLKEEEEEKKGSERSRKGDGSAMSREAAAAYVALVRDHWRRLVDLLSSNYGLSVEVARGFAVERRVCALSLYTLLLNMAASVLRGTADADVYGSLFVPGVMMPLVADLADGWSLLRVLARDTLALFVRRAPPSVLAAVLPAEEKAVTAAQVEAHEEIVKSQTYRSAEGAVARYMVLLSMRLDHGGEAAPGGGTTTTRSEATRSLLYSHRLREELSELGRQTEALRVLQRNAATASSDPLLNRERRRAVYDWLQSNPLHGRLSLCTELLSESCKTAQKLTVDKCSSSSSSTTTTTTTHVEESNTVLRCCCEVIHLCSSLVGGTNNTTTKDEARRGDDSRETGNPTGGGPSREVVDCRGHVYDRESPEAELIMRRVVNNTWLSIRVATLAIHRVLKLSAVEALALAQVKQVAHELMEALLLTKHNGVMRCVRGALKALAEALVRCRDRCFYNLPSDMLFYLLGSEGVTSDDFYRMLRRSQGLPHAVLAVLEAEDPTVPFVLFPVAMKKLLSVARGDRVDSHSTSAATEAGEEREAAVCGAATAVLPAIGDNKETVHESQRSNALNVLKFVFEDKVFADRSVAYIEEAFSLSTAGFNDGSWYIRNSSLMLYSSVLQRFVGEHPATGGAGVNTSLHDIARRTPRGVAFALEALSGKDAAGAGTHHHQGQPSLALFPILQMLSMLAPDAPHRLSRTAPRNAAVAASATENEEEEDSSDPSAPTATLPLEDTTSDAAVMIAAVRRCAVSPHLMIRSASAVALSCLVPADYVCDTLNRIAHDQLRVVMGNAQAGEVRLPSMNVIHGTVLELLQFHTVYVGTLRRNRRLHRLSSYATERLSAAVGQCIATLVVARGHAEVLHRASVLCPTVAASFLTLLHDILYFGSQTWPQQDELARNLREEVVVYATQVAERVVAATSSSSSDAGGEAASPALRADVGQAKETAALVLVVAARLAGTPGALCAATATSVKDTVCRVVASAVAELDLAAGSHNVVSWMLDHLHYYTSAKPPVEPGSIATFLGGRGEEDTLALVKAVESWGTNHGIRAASLVALTKLFASASAGRRLGCVAWGEVVAHLQFAAVLAGEPDPIAESQHTILQAELMKHMVSARDGSPAAGEPAQALPTLPNSDAQSAVIRYVARRASLQPLPSAFPKALLDLLSCYALPEQPVACRESVVASLGDLLAPLSGTGVLKMGTRERRSVGLLIFILTRLIFDDLTAIREAACGVSSRFFAVPQRQRDGSIARDVMSNVLSVVLFARALGEGVISPADVQKYFTLEDRGTHASGNPAGDSAAEVENGKEGSEGDEEEEEEALFNKEADNMYIEDSLLSYIVSRMPLGGEGQTTTTTTTMCPSLSTLDDLLQAAERDQTLLPSMGGEALRQVL